jgi:hypothetical protein
MSDIAADEPHGLARNKVADRFRYWLNPDINRWHSSHALEPPFDPASIAAAVHAERSAFYGAAHLAGDDDALISFAKENARCFRAEWFVVQLERWRDDGQDAKLRSVMSAFCRNTTKTAPSALHAEIVRDQQIFRRLMERAPDTSVGREIQALATELQATDDGLQEDSIWNIYKHYKPYFDEQLESEVSPGEFFDRLTDMANRLALR